MQPSEYQNNSDSKPNHEEENFQEQKESPNYHFKWMIVLLLVAIIGSFVFKYLMQS